MARNVHFKDKRDDNKHRLYRQSCNEVVRLRRESINQYFQERCKNGPDNKQFWSTIKPFMTNKGKTNTNIMLRENGEVLTDNQRVCDVFNNYYVNIADGIGENTDISVMDLPMIIAKYDDHPSVRRIKEQMVNNVEVLDIQSVSEKSVNTLLKQLDVKKSTGFDNIPAKLLRIGAKPLTPSLTSVVNQSISKAIVPSDMKKAEVSPVFKKDDRLNKTKYRPVSVLTIISKLTEKLIARQTSDFFERLLSSSLSAYRRNYSCEHVLIKALEDWKKAVDAGEHVGAILMDLSKAFDTIPHGLLLAKLHAYGANENTCKLFMSYLTGRKQRVKVKDARSKWVKVKKGVPQGSVLGPLLFNIFLNDIYLVIEQCSMYNYADDNTLSYHHTDVAAMSSALENDAQNTVKWFTENEMQANPDKFQGITFGKTSTLIQSFQIQDAQIECSETVKLLGITFDKQLKFQKHVDNICENASRQINMLLRLSRRLEAPSKRVIYDSFITANFSYCPLVWMMCGKVNSDKIENLQYRALKFVYNEYDATYSELMEMAGVNSLLIGRMRRLAIEVFKCVHKISPNYVCEMFEIHNVNYDFRDPFPLQQRSYKTITHGRRTFSYMGSKLWNDLPNDIKCITSIEEFRSMMKKWDGDCPCRDWYL